MTFNHYFFNRGLWMHAWRQGGWIGVIYLLLMIFAGPMQLLISNSAYEYQNDPRVLDYMFKEDGEIAILFAFIMCILMAVFLMRYIQSKRAAEMFHSLPVRREQLFTVSLVSGLTMLIIPIWITALISGLMVGNLNHVVFTVDQVIDWAVSLTVISLFIFTFTLFVGMCIGQSILQIIVTVILFLLPSGLNFLYIRYFSRYLYGYYDEDSSSQFITGWSPIEKLLDVSANGFSQRDGWIYFIVSLVLIGLSYLLYKLRPTEKSTQPIVFRYFNPLFRVGVTLCSALLIGLYGITFFGKWDIVWCIIGGVIGYLAAEMVLRKTRHVFDRKLWIGMVFYGVIVALLIYIPMSPLTGYETKVPVPSEVTSVYIGNDIRNDLPAYTTHGMDIEKLNPDMLSSDPDYIQSIVRLHSQVVKDQPDPGNRNDRNYYNVNEQVQIAYVLKDGSRLFRSYMIPKSDEYRSYLQEIQQSGEYKMAFYNLKALGKSDSAIKIRNPDIPKRHIYITQPSEIKQLNQLIIKEKLAVKNPKNNLIYGNTLAMVIQIYKGPYYSNEHYYSWDPQFKPTEQWLKEKGYWDLLVTKVEDISAIVIVPDERTQEEFAVVDYADLFKKYRGTPQQVIISNKNQINELLNRSETEGENADQSYILKLRFKDGTGAYRVLNKESITPDIYKILPK
ncbi:ABC transporter permease [Paenibacillus wulumuqiensis]|uniref:ABC transporter permease n=1 Tax=Paenibacillus wulumuqiensis TaxID=1567107 RepID=UPI0006193D75|nr:ABC transporter permease [Paenibacillus wulumuqiensis]